MQGDSGTRRRRLRLSAIDVALAVVMHLLGSCNTLRRTLINAAARYTYGPVVPGVLFGAVY